MLTVVLAAFAVIVVSSVVLARRRKRIGERDFTPQLSAIGLKERAHRGTVEYRATDWNGQVLGRGVRVRILERPGSDKVLVWVRCRLPGRLYDGLELRDAVPGVSRLVCRPVAGGYRLQCQGVNARALMGDVELGLPAIEHKGTFSLHAQLRDHWLEIGTSACPTLRVAEVVQDIVALVNALQVASDAPWQVTADALGLQLQPHDKDGHRRLAGLVDGIHVEAFIEDGRTVVDAMLDEPIGGLRVVHRELGNGEPIGNPVLDMLISAEGSRDAFAVLLADDHLVEALMAVVHARKGSELTGERVILREPDEVRGDLAASVRAAVAVAVGIRRVLD